MFYSLVERLKKRQDFVRLRNNSWCFVLKSFVIQMAPRVPDKGAQKTQREFSGLLCSTEKKTEKKEGGEARLGFTVTRRLGGAVIRNRARRRLKSIAFKVQDLFLPSYDYVMIARQDALEENFEEMIKNLRYGIHRLHKMAQEGKPFSSPPSKKRK